MEEKRFIDIESKLLHQENLLEELHQVLYSQQKTIDLLQTQLSSLTNRLQEVTDRGLEIRSSNEKPPHY
ncbi:MAG: SlyX family protein [Pseudobdellovibrio sp.]